MAARIEITPGEHVLGDQNLDQIVARESCQVRIDLDDGILVIGNFCRIVREERKPRNARQLVAIEKMVAAVGGEEVGGAFERRKPHRGRQLAHFAVRADVNDAIEAGEAEVPHQAHLLSQAVVVGRHGPPFAAVDELGGMKAEDLGRPKTADHAPSIRAAERVGGVEDERQVVPAGDGFEPFDGTGTAPKVDADDATRARRDHPLDPARIERVSLWIDVAEDGGDFLPLQGVGRGDEGEGRHDDLACKLQRPDGDFQRHGCVAHGHAVLDADVLRDAHLEFRDKRPLVAEPAAIENAFDAPEQLRAVAEVRATDVQRLIEGLRPAEDG